MGIIDDSALINLIAGYMVAQGCHYSISGNWFFDFNNICKEFHLPLSFMKQFANGIVNEIEKYSQVAEAECGIGGISIYFYTGYCGLEEEEE